MKLKALIAGTFIAMASTVAQAANNYLVTMNDLSEGPITATIFRNGSSIQSKIFPAETVISSFTLFSGATVVTSFDSQFNFYEPGTRVLSDTSEISGSRGSRVINIRFLSDDSRALTPLPNGGVNFETGGFQNVGGPGVVSNGDVYTFQIASDVEVTSAVPEPATWAMMLLGFGGLGAVMRATHRSRKSGAALAAA